MLYCPTCSLALCAADLVVMLWPCVLQTQVRFLESTAIGLSSHRPHVSMSNCHLGLQVYRAEAQPVEDVFRKVGLLIDFPVTGGIPETFPMLVKALEPYNFAPEESKQQLRQNLH